MSPPGANSGSASESGRRRSRWARWVAGVVAVLLPPKCLACVAGYVALAAGLGYAGAEICGASEADALVTRGARLGLSSRQTALGGVGAVVVLLAALTFALWRGLRGRAVSKPVRNARAVR